MNHDNITSNITFILQEHDFHPAPHIASFRKFADWSPHSDFWGGFLIFKIHYGARASARYSLKFISFSVQNNLILP